MSFPRDSCDFLVSEHARDSPLCACDKSRYPIYVLGLAILKLGRFLAVRAVLAHLALSRTRITVLIHRLPGTAHRTWTRWRDGLGYRVGEARVSPMRSGFLSHPDGPV